MASVFDPSRKKFVSLTPEEAVRQRVVQWLIETLSVPLHLVETEFALKNVEPRNSDRVDVLVHDFREGNSVKKPWLLVECKRPGVDSPAALQAQVNKYLKVISPKFIMLSLGRSSIFLALDIKSNSYRQVRTLPEYPPLTENSGNPERKARTADVHIQGLGNRD